ncbi:AAA domain protein [Conidiobolus coronatus NRRL 28638]|uniref:AAA domain protein n=1 Tax=Conidiobolus coronatus (strain ATCC 28846 / CBS 209.66 / NRRL 28638) TaxID=796925 RepID=A0A137PBU6_CONC2|nr:AAA domain protein [Conidiobolus coronatus NRRL 28638]|eukprot:KXN72470.1 AAA domain protein [Conidiobolus coronatus NRRL 28638]
MPRTSKANKEEPEDERLKNLDANMIQMIKNEIMGTDLNITWDDIAGLTHAKKTMNEIIVQPIKRPDLFRGLTAPPKGLLLFGPPGTGKTLIGKCIASESQATFFSISASTLTSKWVGEGEKMMRTLFAVARCHQPAVVFLDEVDSLLTSRTEGENEASRRIKTEFLVQFEGVGTTFEEDRILIIGATNRPQEIDEAARRRFRKRLYIPLPDFEGRLALIKRALRNERNTLSEDDFKEIAQKTEGYSGSDLYGLCQEAAFVPLRNVADISSVAKEDVEPISISSFNIALTQIRKSVASSELKHYEAWNQEFGSMG